MFAREEKAPKGTYSDSSVPGTKSSVRDLRARATVLAAASRVTMPVDGESKPTSSLSKMLRASILATTRITLSGLWVTVVLSSAVLFLG